MLLGRTSPRDGAAPSPPAGGCAATPRRDLGVASEEFGACGRGGEAGSAPGSRCRPRDFARPGSRPAAVFAPAAAALGALVRTVPHTSAGVREPA